MRKKFSLFLFLLIISNEIVYGKHRNKTKEKSDHKKQGAINSKLVNNRFKRSPKDDMDVQKGDVEKRKYYSDPKLDKEPPFWGTRGRRDSSEELENNLSLNKYLNIDDNHHKFSLPNYNFKREDEEESPFWGNRGRRNSDESEEMLFDSDIPLYKQRRQEDDPFWGTRGRRYMKGNKERQKNYILNTDEEPFWGNRGRRQENDPFWGNRGRRHTDTFLDTLEKQKHLNHMALSDETEPFWGNRGRRRLKLKNAIMRSIKEVKDKINDIVGIEHNEETMGDSGRYLGPQFSKLRSNPAEVMKLIGNELNAKKSDHDTVLDDRIYAEEPYYILVERSSRSSAEFDPFFISRGKKLNNFDFAKSSPSRRGAIEDLVKSVRNDPYYIARGKKDFAGNMACDSPFHRQNLFCFMVDQILNKNKVKRGEAESSDRDRRTILKNLALKLQMDPYYVSRGKKDLQNVDNGYKYDHVEEDSN